MPETLIGTLLSREQFYQRIAELQPDQLKNIIFQQMCIYLHQHELNPLDYGFWYSRSQFQLFSLEQIYARAGSIAAEYDLAMHDVRVDVNGASSDITFYYMYDFQEYEEWHCISDYLVLNEGLYEFFKL